METGRWKGVAAGTEETLSSGTYCAKWRNSGGSWVIEAEIYVTLS
jgi:hypothetical protein